MNRALAFIAAFTFAAATFAAPRHPKLPKIDKAAAQCFQKCQAPLQNCTKRCNNDQDCVTKCVDDLTQCTSKCPQLKPENFKAEE